MQSTSIDRGEIMNEKEALKILVHVGAIITDTHVVYTSGKHGTSYVNKDALYPHTISTAHLCRAIAEQFMDDNVETVIAPAIGGVILSQWVADHLTYTSGHEVVAVYAERCEDRKSFVIKRGYDKFITGKNVLVVEDVLNTGGSARKVVLAAREVGGKVIALGALYNRGGVTPEDVGNVPKLISLVNMKHEAWDEDECARTGPCAKGIPINTDVGKGREFLSRKQV